MNNKGKSGFALIISLSVMALIMGMVLAMASMIRISTKQMEVGHNKAVARENAMLSLKIAMGNLQKYTSLIFCLGLVFSIVLAEAKSEKNQDLKENSLQDSENYSRCARHAG